MMNLEETSVYLDLFLAFKFLIEVMLISILTESLLFVFIVCVEEFYLLVLWQRP